jgi:uncharacterized integral membrane protein
VKLRVALAAAAAAVSFALFVYWRGFPAGLAALAALAVGALVFSFFSTADRMRGGGRR